MSWRLLSHRAPSRAWSKTCSSDTRTLTQSCPHQRCQSIAHTQALQEVAPAAVLSDWDFQAQAAPSRSAWRSFPQLAGSLLGRDNLPSPSVCHEVSAVSYNCGQASCLQSPPPLSSLPCNRVPLQSVPLRAQQRDCVLQQVFSLSTATMPDPDSARLELKRYLGDLATMRGRSLGGPLPMLPLGSQDNDTLPQVCPDGSPRLVDIQTSLRSVVLLWVCCAVQHKRQRACPACSAARVKWLKLKRCCRTRRSALGRLAAQSLVAPLSRYICHLLRAALGQTPSP